MLNAVKIVCSMLASIALIYLLALITSFYITITIPFMIPAIIWIWRQDKFIGIGALIALILELIFLTLLIYGAATMKISF